MRNPYELTYLSFYALVSHKLYVLLSVQLFILPLSNRAADAEPGPHSKTAGVQVSQLINTHNCVPPQTTFRSPQKNTKRKRVKQRQISRIALLNIHWLPLDTHNVGIIDH